MDFLNLLAEFTFGPEQFVLIGLLVVMVVIIIVLPMFTNKKRQKQINALQESVKVGAVIKTVGGIIGKVVAIKETSPVDKEMVIETGVGDTKTTMVFDIQAVYQVMSSGDSVSQPQFVETGADDNVENTENTVDTKKEDISAETEESVATTDQVSDSVVEDVPNQEPKSEQSSAEESAEKEVAEEKPSLTPSANSSKTKPKTSTTKKTSSATRKTK